MTKILFVDDEPRVLNGLRRMLRPLCAEWDMTFVGSGAAALDQIRSTSFDVIVSDMKMPGMDGATLLREVQRTDPKIVRIALSGHADRNMALRVVQVVHKFLSKPCDPRELREVVGRACRLQSTIHDPRIKAVLGSLESLPSLPEIHERLAEVLARDDVSVNDIARVVERDPAVACKLLQIVNSSYFGLSREVTEIRSAMSMLGIECVHSLSLTTGILARLESGSEHATDLVRRHRDHSDLTTSIALDVLPDPALREACVTSGLLHDVGELVIEDQMPWLQDATPDGIGHAEIGGYLLDLWGLPPAIAEAVAFHHAPSRTSESTFGVLAAIHVADTLADALPAARDASDLVRIAQLDLPFLDRLGVRGQITRWADFAFRAAETAADRSSSLTCSHR